MFHELLIVPTKTGFGGDTFDDADTAGGTLLIVDRTRLPRLPAQNQCIELRPIGEQVTTVTLIIEVDVLGKKIGRDGVVIQVRLQFIEIDAFNPQIAARLTGSLAHWRRHSPRRQESMKRELSRLLDRPDVSRDVFEIATKALA